MRLVAPLLAIGRLAKDREVKSLPAASNYLEPKVLNPQATSQNGSNFMLSPYL
jgi:hypothetical protein